MTDLDEVRALLAAITPGEWWYRFVSGSPRYDDWGEVRVGERGRIARVAVPPGVDRFLCDRTGVDPCAANATFTASVDAALALIERMLPGWELLVTNEGDDPGTWVASIGPRHTFTSYEGVSRKPARAFVSALLAALIAQQEQDDGR